MTIDWWTVGFQTVNVVILIWLLAHFFWRPVSAMIAERRAATLAALADAKNKQTEAAAALAEIERTRAGFGAERATILAEAKSEAEQARAALLASAKTEAAALAAAARAALAAERRAAERDWSDRASRLAVDIAGRLAARLDGAAVRAAFLDWLLAEIRALPEAVRARACEPGVTLDVLSAGPLDADEQARARAAIAAALGATPQIEIKVDASLIAGLELRGPNLVVANSWRSDLAEIQAGLIRQDTANEESAHDRRS